MEYYIVKEKPQIVLSPLETIIFDWKINNMVTYINSLKCINDKQITFVIDINKKIYDFSLQCDEQSNIWIMFVSTVIDHENKTHLKILDMINIINKTYNELLNKTLVGFLNIIEKAVDDYDFNEINSQSSSDSISVSSDLNSFGYGDPFENMDHIPHDEDDDHNEHNEHNEHNKNDKHDEDHENNEYDEDDEHNDYDEDEKYDYDEDEDEDEEHDYFDDAHPDVFVEEKKEPTINVEPDKNEYEDDFNMFSDEIKRKTNDGIIIDYCLLKSNAYEMIDKLKHECKNDIIELKMFEPEASVSIIINELRQLSNINNIKLDMSENNIYNFKVQYKSDKFKNTIILHVNLNTMNYPSSPPTVNMLKPVLKINLNCFINTMDYFKLDNWNPINSLPNMIVELIKLIEKYGEVLDTRESYSELSNYLTTLSILSKISPKMKTNNITEFQIPFIKYSSTSDDNMCSKYNQTWKAGTGYGSYNSKKWDIKKYLESDKYKIGRLHEIISKIKEILFSATIDKYLIEDIKNSCLIEFIVNYLTDNLDLTFTSVENVVDICDKIFDIDITLFSDYVKNFKSNIDHIYAIKKLTPNVPLTNTIINIYNKINNYYGLHNEQTTIINSDTSDIKQKYVDIMKELQFEMCTDLDNVCKKDGKAINMTRIIRETSILSKSLPLDYESSIYVKIDESNMQSMQALIIPSHGTPYSNGCFLFHIYLNESYPLKPPIVILITTGHGTVRFNPNLYTDGKVCLSLLDTWRGDESESWNETSTILQVLISIQSLIFVEQPYFNEPGYEYEMNTELGKKNSIEYNKSISYNTICWGMIDMIKNPPKYFEPIVTNHFKLKKDHIIKETGEWLQNISSNDNSSFAKKYGELCTLLNNL